MGDYVNTVTSYRRMGDGDRHDRADIVLNLHGALSAKHATAALIAKHGI